MKQKYAFGVNCGRNLQLLAQEKRLVCVNGFCIFTANEKTDIDVSTVGKCSDEVRIRLVELA